jgi:hypothetical protein
MTTANSKTSDEVEALKRNWVSDPCYDITDVEGFEEYKAELAAFAREQEARWAAQRAEREAQAAARVSAKAEALGIPGNTALAAYVMGLEERIALIEARLDNE